MDIATEIYSHLCGQQSCLVIEGQTLPVCQRCLGLYAGAAITGAYLVLSGVWRRGLPCLSITLAHITIILLAMLGGIHVLDFGPPWSLLCGVWTGHVVMTWLTAGSRHLLLLCKSASRPSLPWLAREKGVCFVFILALSSLPLLCQWFPRLGWHGWVVAIVVGTAALFACALRSMIVMLRWVAGAGVFASGRSVPNRSPGRDGYRDQSIAPHSDFHNRPPPFG